LHRVMADTVDRTPLLERKDRHGNGLIRFSSFHIEDTEGRKLSAARSGMDIVFVFGFHCKDSSQTKNIDVGFSLHDMDNTAISVHYSSYLGQLFSNVPENGFFRFSLKKLALSQGSYWVGARILVNGVESDWPLNGVGSLFVETGDFYATGNRGFEGKAPVLLDGRWDVLGPHLL
ncbi:MAG: Wzt carbohydrate-binding domain-containing protein, partial [Syntrophales bacterium LBB04]|nr:Wzt carbohydrate-binding domain-containing protein [Syntrophales bacterium LBB04]